MKIDELLQGVDLTKVTTVEGIAKFINDKASELKAKVLIDDGKEDIYVPKARLDKEIGKKKSLKDQLDTANGELEKIKTANKDNDTLVKQIETLQNSNKDLDTKLKQQALDTAIKMKAIGANSIDKTGADVLAFIDKSKLKLNDDGSVEGLDDAIKGLQTAKPYLFGEVNKGGTGHAGQPPKGGTPTVSIGEQLAKARAEESKGLEDARTNFFK